MAIRIFITGGTFDKEYDEISGRLFFKDTHIPEMLKRGRSCLEVEIEVLFMIDSLEMDEAHRKLIAEACVKTGENKIIIIHGTDTMPETARYLQSTMIGKTIILTGAMVPYKFGSSDGFFNLGSAMAFVQTLSEGVYIAMNGRYFQADMVRKNKEQGLFELKTGEQQESLNQPNS